MMNVLRGGSGGTPVHYASARAPPLSDDEDDEDTPLLGNKSREQPKTPRTNRVRAAFGLDQSADMGRIESYRRGDGHAGLDVGNMRLARKIKLFAMKLAQHANKRSADMIDVRFLDEEHLTAFANAVKTESDKTEQWEALMGVFKEGAFIAVHTCLGNLESKEYHISTNRRLMSMNLRSWLNNPQIINMLAKLTAFYVIQPKYLNTAKWPRKEILAQWQNSNKEAMDFFLYSDEL